MSSNNKKFILTQEFINKFLGMCFVSEFIFDIVCTYIEPSYMPSKPYQDALACLKKAKKSEGGLPSFSMFKQRMEETPKTAHLAECIVPEDAFEREEMVEYLEDFISQVRFQQVYRDAGDCFNRGDNIKALHKMEKFSEWRSSFRLQSTPFVDVGSTFEERYIQNKASHKEEDHQKKVCRFYIDDLDELNQQKNLRRQLTCFLASTGVGKSHIARWIGKSASQIDGLDVLHFQLEGSEEEVLDAYSASLVSCSSYLFEAGLLKDSIFEEMKSLVMSMSGTIKVRSYPKFDNEVSTRDIKAGIIEYKKEYGKNPDIVIIDSMDLLTDCRGKYKSDGAERFRRQSVANDLKDIASDENIWVITTYQSNIQAREWTNDENNVLNEYNSSEGKGIARPLTHLITLNQSENENRENTMRIHIAKSRFFKGKNTFKIATNYNEEMFYDRARTMQIRTQED